MSDYQPHSGYASLSLVEAYWDALRAGREMPKRAEIDPRGIENALEHAFILERVASGVARMRIAGTHLHDIMGMEARGMPITAFFEQECRLKVSGLLEEVFQTPGCAELMMQSHGSLGQPSLEARMILLPLKSDLGDVSRILGCLVCVGDLGGAPRRFDLTSTTFRNVSDANGPRMPLPQLEVKGFGERPQPIVQPQAIAEEPAQPSWPPYLRLVKSDS
ncbi:MAG: PAS domain-containing protein [Sulfitobacter sp.]